MSHWETASATAAQWDGWLHTFPHAHVYQSSAWAAYKQAAGWQCVRFVLRGEDSDGADGGVPSAMMQGLVKRVPLFGGMMWVPGGPLWRAVPSAIESAALARAVGTSSAARYVRLFDLSEAVVEHAPSGSYVPFVPQATPLAVEAEVRGYAVPWRRPQVPNGSGVSVLIDVTQPRAVWLEAMTSKHRYYVRRALREPVQWKAGNELAQLDALATLTSAMGRIKGAAHQRSVDELQAQCAALGPSVMTLVGYLDGQAVSGCQVLRWGTMAIYATAATNEAGRAISAAYAMIAELRDLLRAEGVVALDFGGIDPGNPAARGVDHFKRGFGRTATYAGEWEWAASPLARTLGNLAVWLRRGRCA